MSTILVARQPIFEIGRGLFGYELLYRKSVDATTAHGDQAAMSAELISSALLGMDINSLAGNALTFINFARVQLLSENWTFFEPSTTVIELLETNDCDREALAACEKLVKAGYRLALDDYVYGEWNAPFLEFASIVKIDVLGKTRADIERQVEMLRGRRVRLLAERVETAEVRDICIDLGFDLFQGYLFGRPETFAKKDVTAGQHAIMRLLNLLQDPETPDSVLEDAFAGDVALAYKLLRMVNAASVGGLGVDSIPHAIRLIGRQTLHRWVALLFIASLGKKGDVSQEIALTAITRARMCELLATASGDQRSRDSAFIVGLLSLIDVLLEGSMETIVGRLELSDHVRGALLDRGGPLAGPLKLVEAYEGANWDRAQGLAFEHAVPGDRLPGLYLDAVRWAAERVV